MDGMCTRVEPAANQIFLVNASAGFPEDPSPDSGEVIQMPRVLSAAGMSAVKSVKPGDQLVTVWSQQTAIRATIIR
jgi:hypothetical protein